jgi:hypothetical protein
MQEDLIRNMRDKDLNFSGRVVSVLYNKQGDKRFVVLHEEKGYYTYLYQELIADDAITAYHPERLPAYWVERYGEGKSLFASVDEALKGLRYEPLYLAYFQDNDIDDEE